MIPGARFYYGWAITIILLVVIFISFIGTMYGRDKTIRRLYKCSFLISTFTFILAINSIKI